MDNLKFMILIAFVNAGELQANENDIGIAISKHKSARIALTEMSCELSNTVVVKKTQIAPEKTNIGTGRFWYGHNYCRAKINDLGYNEIEYVWQDNLIKSSSCQTINGVRNCGGTISNKPNKFIHRIDAWKLSLLVLQLPGKGEFLLLEDLVAAADSVKCKAIGNDYEIKLKFNENNFRKNDRTVDLLLDSQSNYLIKKAEYRFIGNDKAGYTNTIPEFYEVKKGVYFPKELKYVSTGATGSTFFTKVTVDSNPKDITDFRFANGLRVLNDLTNESYKSDESGRPIGPSKPAGRNAPPPLDSTEKPVEIQIETIEEPKRNYNWVIYVSLGLLFIATIMFVKKRQIQNV